MPIQKPSKPGVTLPDSFGGVKTPYSSQQIANGYQVSVPTTVDGGNINYEKDALFQNNKYLKTVVDALVDMPVGKVLTVDSNNRFDYTSQEALPDQNGNEGKFLTTDGTSASWEDIPEVGATITYWD